MSEELRDTIRDELLVLRSQQGEVDALTMLVDRWQQRLYRYALRLTGNRELALDAVQETWLAVIQGLVRLKDITRFKVWLFRVVSNKCKDRFRQDTRTSHLLNAAADHCRSQVSTSFDDRGELWEVVERLSYENQAVLTLKYVEGFTISEIADVLNTPEGTVKSRLHYAREAIRKAIERKQPWKNGNMI